MMTTIQWRQSPAPLTPEGILVTGEQKQHLFECLAQMTSEQLATLRGSHNEHIALLIGPPESLPWLPVSGSSDAVYVGKNPLAPHLWLPTHLTPSVPIDLLDKAIIRQFGAKQFVLEPHLKQLFGLDTLASLATLKIKELSE